MKLFNKQLSASSCPFLPLQSKYSPQHLALEHILHKTSYITVPLPASNSYASGYSALAPQANIYY